ncbi:MAG: PepSY-associated TM helix domain-containing protein [Bacteroidota bacterium]
MPSGTSPSGPGKRGPKQGGPKQGRAKKLVGPRAFKLFWDAHSVTGIIIGLGLFVIFYAGAFALYRAELHMWADPGMRPAAAATAESRLSVDDIVAPFFAEAMPADGSDVQVSYPFRGRPYYFVRYQTPDGDTTRTVQAYVNATTGETFDLPVGERIGRSALSEILYALHFFGQGGFWGEVVSGFIAIFFMFAVVSGILIHLRKLPKDWHTFRPRGRLRDGLADAHTVLGLIGLPFAAMYAITGAFLALVIILLGPTVLVVFGGDAEAIDATLNGFEMPAHEATGMPAEMLSFSAIEDALPASWDEVDPTLVYVHVWNDEAAIAQVYGDASGSLTRAPQIILSATTGEYLAGLDPMRPTALGGTAAAITNLHYALFGGGFVKVLYFFLALATAAVILTGNILWVLVRRPKDPRATPRLHRVLGRLTVGTGCGLVAAVPVLFLTTAALPIDLPALKAWEHVALFATWAVLAVAAFFGPSAVWAARWQLALGGVLSLLVPVASGVLGGIWPWTAAANGWWGILTIDVGFLLMGPMLLWTAARLNPDALAPALAGDGAAADTPPRLATS